MDENITKLIEQLEEGEITADEFTKAHERELQRIGEEAKQAPGDVVKKERIHEIAEKATKL